MDAILKRRSTRAFTGEEVPDEKIRQLLDAGFHANSAHHLRPWHFIVVDNPDILRELYTAHTNMSMLRTAPIALVVCGDSERSPDFWPDDCAAATENILIAAQSVGLGSFWCAVYPRIQRMESVCRLFGLPETVKPYSVVAVGNPSEQKPPADLYNEVCVHRNIW